MLRITTEWGGSFPGVPYYSTFYFSNSDQAAADAAGLAVSSFWQTVRGVVNTALTWNVVDQAEIVDPATGQTTGIRNISGQTGTGNSAGDPLPSAVNGLLRWRTGAFVGGREVRGRTFIPGPNEVHSTGGLPIAEYMTVLENAGEQLILDVEPLAIMGIYSQKNGASYAVQSASPWGLWANLRNRRQ